MWKTKNRKMQLRPARFAFGQVQVLCNIDAIGMQYRGKEDTISLPGDLLTQ